MSNISSLSAAQAIEKFNNSEFSALEMAQSSLDAIHKCESEIDAYLHVMDDEAIAQAKDIDARKAAGEKLGSLAGTTIAIKDNMATNGIVTTCASKMLENWVPVYDATVIEKLKEQDAIIVGKANMDEFALGSSTENSAFKITKNPHDTKRVPGGSSGGSAATVASQAVTFSLGSDTGGSIRQPASLCGIVGVKPSYGRVSRYGLVAFGSSLDQIGPFARNVEDAAILLDAISGHDPRDSTSIKKDYEPIVNSLGKSIEGLKVGVIKELKGPQGYQEEVLEAEDNVAQLLEKSGAKVDVVSVPSVVHSTSVYYLIGPAELSSNLARFDGMRYGLRVEGKDAAETNSLSREHGFGEEVKRRIMLGTYALSAGYYDAYYAQAQKVRTLMIEDFRKAYQDFDVLISPTSPTTAFEIGEKVDDPVQMYLNDVCTLPTNLVGATAMSIPVGLDKLNLPIGLQIFAPALGEGVMFQVAHAIEQEVGFKATPQVSFS